ncbi:MAG: hypothetical protein K0U54_03970, partial [Bacteroidetes bacterium]|nr:hypothetical protein [Bacteroidota bacterium]
RALTFADSYSEFERRTRKDLETIGMRPKRQEIDTLIAAGRAIIHLKQEELLQKIQLLSQRKHSKTCDEIFNPTKYYCWPEKFKQVPLVLEKELGVILKVFSDTTTPFIKQTTERRLDKLNEIQRTGLDIKKSMEQLFQLYYTINGTPQKVEQEIEYRERIGLEEETSLDALLDEFSNIVDFIKQDKPYKTDQESTSPFVQKDYQLLLYKTLMGNERGRENITINCSLHDQRNSTEVGKILCRKFQIVYDILYLKETEIREKIKSNPFYYLFGARLAHILDRKEDVFFLLFTGINNFPESEDLQAMLGHFAFLIDENPVMATRHFKHAIANAQLKQLQVSRNRMNTVGDYQKNHSLFKSFQGKENWFKRQLTESLALISGYSLPCNDLCREIDRWLEKEQDKERTKDTTTARKSNSPELGKAKHQKIGYICTQSNQSQEEDNCKKNMELDKKKRDLKSDFHISHDEPLKPLQVSQHFKTRKGRLGLRLAHEIFRQNIDNAEQFINKFKEEESDYQESSPGLMQHEILYPLAYHRLITSAQLQCPQRKKGMQGSITLLEKSQKFVLNSIQSMALDLINKLNCSEKKCREHIKALDLINKLNCSEEECREHIKEEFRSRVSTIRTKLDLPSQNQPWIGLVEMMFNPKKGLFKEPLDFENGANPIMILLWDLKLINYFLVKAHELECLGL